MRVMRFRWSKVELVKDRGVWLIEEFFSLGAGGREMEEYENVELLIYCM